MNNIAAILYIHMYMYIGHKVLETILKQTLKLQFGKGGFSPTNNFGQILPVHVHVLFNTYMYMYYSTLCTCIKYGT